MQCIILGGETSHFLSSSSTWEHWTELNINVIKHVASPLWPRRDRRGNSSTSPSQQHGDLLGAAAARSYFKCINGRNDVQVSLIQFHFSPLQVKLHFQPVIFYVFSCFCNPPISKVKQPECSSLQGAILATHRREDRCPGCNMSFSCTTWRVSYIQPSRVLADASSRLWSQNERLWSCSVGSLLCCLQM